MTDLLDVIEKIDEQNDRLKQIEIAISAVAVQNERIVNLQTQMNALWKKYDASFSADGIVSRIQQHQASCPRNQVKYMWCAIFVTALSVIFKFIAE